MAVRKDHSLSFRVLLTLQALCGNESEEGDGKDLKVYFVCDCCGVEGKSRPS
jgi:hypothetical protein